ncbi:MAG: hypothetical protein IJF53_05495, partial [Clostridia bacterium]|nr:hypothetical protein [Clostridia bacterium]
MSFGINAASGEQHIFDALGNDGLELVTLKFIDLPPQKQFVEVVGVVILGYIPCCSGKDRRKAVGFNLAKRVLQAFGNLSLIFFLYRPKVNGSAVGIGN